MEFRQTFYTFTSTTHSRKIQVNPPLPLLYLYISYMYTFINTVYIYIWGFPKIVGFPPKSRILIRVFHYFHHPFWGPTPIFGNTHINIKNTNQQMYILQTKKQNILLGSNPKCPSIIANQKSVVGVFSWYLYVVLAGSKLATYLRLARFEIKSFCWKEPSSTIYVIGSMAR